MLESYFNKLACLRLVFGDIPRSVHYSKTTTILLFLLRLLFKTRNIFLQQWQISLRRKVAEAATGGVLKSKVFLKISQHLQEKKCVGAFFNNVASRGPANLIKEILWQVFSCEYCELFKNTYFEKHLRAAAYEVMTKIVVFSQNRQYQQIFLKIWMISCETVNSVVTKTISKGTDLVSYLILEYFKIKIENGS